MCKFGNSSEAGYIAVKNSIRQILRDSLASHSKSSMIQWHRYVFLSTNYMDEGAKKLDAPERHRVPSVLRSETVSNISDLTSMPLSSELPSTSAGRT